MDSFSKKIARPMMACWLLVIAVVPKEAPAQGPPPYLISVADSLFFDVNMTGDILWGRERDESLLEAGKVLKKAAKQVVLLLEGESDPEDIRGWTMDLSVHPIYVVELVQLQLLYHHSGAYIEKDISESLLKILRINLEKLERDRQYTNTRYLADAWARYSVYFCNSGPGSKEEMPKLISKLKRFAESKENIKALLAVQFLEGCAKKNIDQRIAALTTVGLQADKLNERFYQEMVNKALLHQYGVKDRRKPSAASIRLARKAVVIHDRSQNFYGRFRSRMRLIRGLLRRKDYDAVKKELDVLENAPLGYMSNLDRQFFLKEKHQFLVKTGSEEKRKAFENISTPEVQRKDYLARLLQEKEIVKKLKAQLVAVTKEKQLALSRVKEKQLQLAQSQVELEVAKNKAALAIAAEQAAEMETKAAKNKTIYWSLATAFSILIAGIGMILWRTKTNEKQLVTETQLAKQRQQNAELNLKLARMTRMESLGLMAGSIAHDFNNILVGVGGNAEVLEMAMDLGSFTPEYAAKRVAAIRNSSERATKLARQMLDYAGKQYIARKASDLNDLVENYRTVIESFSQRGHQVKFELSKAPMVSKVDGTQVEQAIFNLVTNAVDASPNGSKITIRSRMIEFDSSQLDDTYFGTQTESGHYCCVEVEDHGCGIAVAQRDRIFDPYFSNSAQGRGLGLAVVYGIVQSHDGMIRCESEVGKGTKFTLMFPVTDENVDDSINEYLQDSVVEFDPACKNKHVLVIDDEPTVLETCEQMVQQFGLQTSTALGGEAGLEEIITLQTSENPIDCVLMDVMMPRMSAKEVLAQLAERGISIPIILMSGYSKERLDFFHKNKDVFSIVPKPFDLAKLRTALLEALQAESKNQRVPKPKYQTRTKDLNVE